MGLAASSGPRHLDQASGSKLGQTRTYYYRFRKILSKMNNKFEKNIIDIIINPLGLAAPSDPIHLSQASGSKLRSYCNAKPKNVGYDCNFGPNSLASSFIYRSNAF